MKGAAVKYIAIVFVVMIFIESGTNTLIIFRQFAYGIHPITGTMLEKDPPKPTSGQQLGQEDEGSTFWVDICQAIGGIATAVALILVWFQYRQISIAESGFIKLDLECSYEANEDKYIVSKTVLENTIIVVHAFLLIVDQHYSYEEGRHMVEKYCFDKIPVKRNITNISTAEAYLQLFRQMFGYIAENGGLLERDNFIIKLLPYSRICIYMIF